MSGSQDIQCRLSPQNNNGTVLTRTLRNLEQAQGGVRNRTTAAEILQAPGNEEVDMTMPLPSDQAPAAGSVANSSNHSTAPAVFPTVVTLTRDLNTSTALLQNLRTRNSILAEDFARHHRETAAQRSSKAKWKVLAIILLVVWALYLWWCWHMCVEMEYIRKRRGEAFSGL